MANEQLSHSTSHQNYTPNSVINTILGERRFDPQAYLYLPDGLIGFHDCYDFVIIDNPPLKVELSQPLYLMQSLNMLNACFLILPYTTELGWLKPTDLAVAHRDLQLEPSTTQIFCIAHAHSTDQETLTVTINLKAPLFMDTNQRRAWQYVFDNPDYPCQYAMS